MGHPNQQNLEHHPRFPAQYRAKLHLLQMTIDPFIFPSLPFQAVTVLITTPQAPPETPPPLAAVTGNRRPTRVPLWVQAPTTHPWSQEVHHRVSNPRP